MIPLLSFFADSLLKPAAEDAACAAYAGFPDFFSSACRSSDRSTAFKMPSRLISARGMFADRMYFPSRKDCTSSASAWSHIPSPFRSGSFRFSVSINGICSFSAQSSAADPVTPSIVRFLQYANASFSIVCVLWGRGLYKQPIAWYNIDVFREINQTAHNDAHNSFQLYYAQQFSPRFSKVLHSFLMYAIMLLYSPYRGDT